MLRFLLADNCFRHLKDKQAMAEFLFREAISHDECLYKGIADFNENYESCKGSNERVLKI